MVLAGGLTLVEVLVHVPIVILQRLGDGIRDHKWQTYSDQTGHVGHTHELMTSHLCGMCSTTEPHTWVL